MDDTNILTPQLLSIFPNLDYVHIVTSGILQQQHYIFSLYELLLLIKDETVNKLWESSSEILIETFQKENFNIIMHEIENDHDDASLMITRN